LGKFYGNVYTALTKFLILNGILASFGKKKAQNVFPKRFLSNLKLVIMFKFEPSSKTYAIILFFKPYPSKDQSSFFANAYHIFSKTLNKPNVT
jgi:hypothetical protein